MISVPSSVRVNRQNHSQIGVRINTCEHILSKFVAQSHFTFKKPLYTLNEPQIKDSTTLKQKRYYTLDISCITQNQSDFRDSKSYVNVIAVTEHCVCHYTRQILLLANEGRLVKGFVKRCYIGMQYRKL